MEGQCGWRMCMDSGRDTDKRNAARWNIHQSACLPRRRKASPPFTFRNYPFRFRPTASSFFTFPRIFTLIQPISRPSFCIATLRTYSHRANPFPITFSSELNCFSCFTVIHQLPFTITAFLQFDKFFTILWQNKTRYFYLIILAVNGHLRMPRLWLLVLQLFKTLVRVLSSWRKFRLKL